ncbi:MAG: DoxX family protein [Candidatus Amulumruptor caecigallinarius]|nr:DoxX family protein [Candidatus Amulumruptor caecigallinarius]
MPSSHSSSSDSNNTEILRNGIYCSIITWMLRLAVGGTFIFSGFVKSVDPRGAIYKFEEYFAALHLPVFHSFILVAAFALCILEFLIGAFFIFGCYRKSTPVIAFLFMCVMTPLTLWIALTDPVKDCGCFGDALILSNWDTFIKNVILTAAIVWLMKFNKRSAALIMPELQWISIVVSSLFIVFIASIGYISQPLIDFRAYPVGGSLVENSESSQDDEEDNFIFEYTNGKEIRHVGVNDELPSEEDGWQFVKRIEKPVADSENKSGTTESHRKTFRLWSIDGEEDLTSDAVKTNGDEILILMPELKNVSPAMTWKINSLYDYSVSNNIKMAAVVSGSTEEIEIWKDLSMPQYEIYTGDDTSIKEVARGNPAIVYLSNGKIKWKSTLNALDVEDFKSVKGNDSLKNINFSATRTLYNTICIYVITMLALIGLSFSPKLFAMIQTPFHKK